LILSYIALCITGFVLPQFTNAQCSGPFKSISYNSVISGSGNDYHSITMPQFDPSKGTLVAVKITSVISLQYAFQLENNNNSSTTYTVGVGRNDYIGSTALSSPLTNMNHILQNYGPYSLAASNGVAGSGPDFISVPQFTVLNNYADISDSITTSVANFLGMGTVEFDYYTTTYYNITGNYAFSNTSSDNINFTVAYYYCNTAVLASAIIDFLATKQDNETIKLAWTTENEVPGLTYQIQKSADGNSFSDVVSMPANPSNNDVENYSYYYSIDKADKDKIYFRIKMTDANGNTKYSEIRMIELNNTGGISLFPNPSNSFVNIFFNQQQGNWQVDIFAPNGDLVQRNNFSNTNLAHIGFIKRLAPGLYFIHAYEQALQKSYVLSFSIQ